MSAGRICVREVDVITKDETARVAARRMQDRKVGTLVVVDRDRHPIGMVTDRDLTVRVLAAGKDGTQVPVSEVMTPAPKCIGEQTPIEDALQAMRAGPFRRVPVVDEERKLVGLLSLDDVLELFAEEFFTIGRLIEDEEPTSLGNL